MKKEKILELELEHNRIYMRIEQHNSISAKIDVTDFYHFMQEFFNWEKENTK
jgi:hypothetical protein